MAQRLRLVTLPAVTVTTAGTRVAAYSSTLEVYSATIVSLSTNTGTQYIGDSTVSAANGLPIAPDGSVEFEPPDNMRATDTFNVGEIYVDSSTNGASFRVLAWVRG